MLTSVTSVSFSPTAASASRSNSSLHWPKVTAIVLPRKAATSWMSLRTTMASAPLDRSIMATLIRSVLSRASALSTVSGVVSATSRSPATTGGIVSAGPGKACKSTCIPCLSKNPFCAATNTPACPTQES